MWKYSILIMLQEDIKFKYGGPKAKFKKNPIRSSIFPANMWKFWSYDHHITSTILIFELLVSNSKSARLGPEIWPLMSIQNIISEFCSFVKSGELCAFPQIGSCKGSIPGSNTIFILLNEFALTH